MRKTYTLITRCLTAWLILLSGAFVHAQLSDVTQPGDTLVASSNNSPGSEGVANAIDNTPNKYLNFDILNTGFTVTPAVGGTRVTGLTLVSANDAPERDPSSFLLEGSLDGSTFFVIASNTVPAFADRYGTNTILFPNDRVYATYRLTFPTVADSAAANSMQIAEVEFLGVVADLPQDVTQPGDMITASSNNSPGSEGVANAIDNTPNKYLNFDILNTGFTVVPSAGLTIVSGITLTSANDAPERDPASYTLEGSYDGTTFTMIASGTVPAFADRYTTQTIFFTNNIPYRQYRVLFPTVTDAAAANSMQISEVELLGVLAPGDITVPGDVIVASSNNSPGSEGVANAIDNTPNKYLNFDILNTGFTVTPGVGDTVVTGLSLESANDAPERDPASYTLEGSNDGTNFTQIASGSVPTFPSRYYTNYVFFPDNTNSYKSYRLLFPTVADAAAANSMQIAEIEFLGITPGLLNTNPVDTLIRRQPQDTPVLLGHAATFRVLLTGPWKVQWFRDGMAIPGANTPNYTTAITTTNDDGALFQAIVQSPKGQQISDEVMLSIFTPSQVESYGISFLGGGANGAPTDVFNDDIVGFFPQAYWNNLDTGSGGPLQLTNSNNEVGQVEVNWATSGTWAAGTGEDDPTSRMLNGIDTATVTDEGSAVSVTLTNVPAGDHTLLLYTVQVPLEFFNMDFKVETFNADGSVKQTLRRYIRPQNSDEYNPAPGYVLVNSDTPETRTVGNMMRFDNLMPDNGAIVISYWSPGRMQPAGAEPIRGPGLNGFQLLLDPGSVPTPPVITANPISANGVAGGQVTLSVSAVGNNLTYQWQKNGTDIPGATGPQLIVSNLSDTDKGAYSVAISNDAGRVASKAVVVDVLPSDQITEGLVTYFKFDEAGDPTAINDAPGGMNGEVRGDFPDAVPAPTGIGLFFNGVNNYVYVPDYPKPSAAMTVAVWVKSLSDQWGPVVNDWLGANAIGERGQFLLDIAPNASNIPTLTGELGVGPNQPLASVVIDPTLDMWHHVALTASGRTLSLYIDGQIRAQADYLGPVNQPSFPWLSIGADLTDPNQPPSRVWSGGMDDLAIWSRNLSAPEIQAIYNGGLSGLGVSDVPPVLMGGGGGGEPTLNISRSGNAITVSWDPSVTGFTLRMKTSLDDPTWTDVPIMAVPPTNSFTIIGASGTAYFQLQNP